MGNKGRQHSLARKRAQNRRLAPALHRPERFELERRADAYVAARARRDQIVAWGILTGTGAALLVSILAGLGLL